METNSLKTYRNGNIFFILFNKIRMIFFISIFPVEVKLIKIIQIIKIGKNSISKPPIMSGKSLKSFGLL